MDIPRLLALMVVVASEGHKGQDALDRLKELLDGKTVQPDDPVSNEIERRARNSQLMHDAYIREYIYNQE